MVRAIRMLLAAALMAPGPAAAAGDRPRMIVLDPGHGGAGGSVKTGNSQESDGASWNNATSATLKLLEKDLTLSFCKAIRTEVEGTPEFKQGEWKIVLTRSEDVHLGAMERAAVAVRESADLFVSVHFNASNEHRASGTRVFHVSEDHPKWEYYHFTNPYPARDRRFATLLCERVAEALRPLGGKPDKRLVYGDGQDRIDGIRMLGYARTDTHLYQCAMGLLEVEFIDNPEVEAWLLKDPQRALSETAVAKGCVEAFRAWFALSPAERDEVTKARKAPGR